ncbi:transposase [Vibrio sp. T187]|uniref:exonuclease domain-containing protein n=1 Tax=Vibrio TaxID=662 RepID=UPI0010C966D0|nr:MULTISPECIES: exonuclease domain-containing protein [Vibrio]MBW3697959.1 transposase [Vibrio sp. T187]
MEFIALDVETANPDMSSICQIGLVKYRDGKVVDEWVTLINPEDYFFFANIDVHGITEDDVQDAPTLPIIYDRLKEYIDGQVVVHHTHFDRVSINRALDAYGLEQTETKWLDTARLARRTWEEVSKRGYGLKNVASNLLGFEFNHHDALEDAKACGQIFLAASEKQGLNVLEAFTFVQKKPKSTYKVDISKSGDPDGELFGELLAFTGTLQFPRKEAAEYAARLGCSVKDSVTKKTTMLVVGDQDLNRLAEGKKKSSKHLKAEKLISEGQQIKILLEKDFMRLLVD